MANTTQYTDCKYDTCNFIHETHDLPSAVIKFLNSFQTKAQPFTLY